MNSSQIQIHDTTLRDGEQMPGVVFGFNEKIKLAEKIMEFGAGLIDIMPVVSDSEFRVTKELTDMFGSRVSPTCRIKKADIDTAIECGAGRITLFAPLSDLHITKKLGTDRQENLSRSLEMIDYARSHGLLVDFAGEDSTRADFGYFKDFLKAVQNRIQVFFVADTVGCLTPNSARNLVSYLKGNFSCEVGIHTHNDFGMATANTVEAVLAGAEYFSGTFTGIGERAGNAPIEEVCVSLRHLHGMDIGVRYEMLKDVCDLVQQLSGVLAQRHKPVIGENAFAHESGIHVDGVLKDPKTYEPFEPGSVGQKRSIHLGKHSGRKGVEHLLYERFTDRRPDIEDIDAILRGLKGVEESASLMGRSKIAL
jgi:isopropylmalate/homocitrate/citramalate synthase